ncbi:MAG: hypothetical protein HDQ88_10485 [Clostridia bacterium]|nr:hypothetical protein [Clostridia bacterium]
MNENPIEFPVEKPKPIAPATKPATTNNLDTVVQWTIPKLIDKVRMAEWKADKAEWECEQAKAALAELAKRVDALAMSAPKKRSSKKKPVEEPDPVAPEGEPAEPETVAAYPPVSTPVAMSSFCIYDDSADTWKPYAWQGVEATGPVVTEIRSIDLDTARAKYPAELVDFAHMLSDDAYKLLVATFPK